MKRKKLKRRFSNIHKSIFDKMSSRERQPIAKYNGMMNSIEKMYEEIEDYKHLIEEIEKKIRKYSKSCERIYDKHKHLEEDYTIRFYFTVNEKVIKSGEVRKYWMINLKYKGDNKSIYLGSEEKVKEVVKNELNEDVSDFDKDSLIDKLFYLIKDNLEDMVVKKQNLFDENITLSQLIN